MRNSTYTFFFVLVIWLAYSSGLYAQKTPQEYQKTYPTDFQEALDFLKKHKTLFVEELGKEAGDVRLISAIAFPEMVRYSELSNMFETATIETLYTKFGTKYADFSVGIFQMKPSFVESLEKYLQENWLTVYKDVWQYDVETEIDIRAKRVARMKTLKWQLRYLRAFYSVILHKFPTQLTQENAVNFLAAAYNRGFHKSADEILRWSKIFAFPHGIRYTGKQYNYAEIAQYYHKKYSASIF